MTVPAGGETQHFPNVDQETLLSDLDMPAPTPSLNSNFVKQGFLAESTFNDLSPPKLSVKHAHLRTHAARSEVRCSPQPPQLWCKCECTVRGSPSDIFWSIWEFDGPAMQYSKNVRFIIRGRPNEQKALFTLKYSPIPNLQPLEFLVKSVWTELPSDTAPQAKQIYIFFLSRRWIEKWS